MPRLTNQATAGFVELARQAFPEAPVYPALSRLSESGARPVLLVVQAARLDPIQWPALQQSLAAGTPLLFWGRDPLQSLADAPPDLPMISPSFRHFESPALKLRWPDRPEASAFKALVQSPWPQPPRYDAKTGIATRWIPVAETEGLEESVRAWPASVWVESLAHAPLRSWGWVGVDAQDAKAEAAVELLRATAQRLQAGSYVLPLGPDQASYEGAHRLEVAVRVVRRDQPVSALRVAAELTEQEGRSVRRITAAATDEVPLGLGVLPRLARGHRDFSLTLRLEDAEGQTLDHVERSLRVVSAGKPELADVIGVSGAGFKLGRRPLYVFGAALTLGRSEGVATNEPDYAPLDPEVFDPDAVRRALRQAQQAGINVVDLALEDERQIPALRWLMEEMRPLSMWLYVRLGGLDPLTLDLPRARRLLEKSRLIQDPILFALEAGSRSVLGDEIQRRALDEAWRDWLIEQYGSLEHAEMQVGVSWWMRDGVVTGPPDAVLNGEESAGAALAVYRRFVDDWISRRLGCVRAMLDDAGCQALVGACRGWGGPPSLSPLDPGSGAVHLDFITLDAAGLERDDAARAVAGFVTTYARGMALGKPVMWRNVGYDAGREPGAGELALQAQRVQELMNMGLLSHAAGQVVTRLSGGWSPHQQRDEGYAFPDGRWRPAGDELRRFTLRVRREATPPPSWTEATVSRDDHPRGLYDWLIKRSPNEPRSEVRPVGFAQSSFDLAPLAVGGRPYVAPAPWQMLNAEWGAVHTASQRVMRALGEAITMPVRDTLELDVWNTGPARWVNAGARRAGAIWLRAAHPTAKEQWVLIPETMPGQRTQIRWTPTDAGRWELRMWNWASGGFGEPLTVEVK